MDANPVNQPPEDGLNAAMFQVFFAIPSLREEILKHVIFSNGNVDRKGACTLRLVHPSWNGSVVKILRKAHEPLLKLAGGARGGMGRCIKTFSASARILGSIPPLVLQQSGDLRQPGTLAAFSNCLTRFGAGLVQMGFTVTENGRPFNTELPNWSLLGLHKMEINVNLNLAREQEEGAVEDETLSSRLINSVLSNATSLSELEFFINCASRSQSPVLPVGLLLGILDNYRASLKTCTIFGHSTTGASIGFNPSRFPVMDKLEDLSLVAIDIAPEPGVVPFDGCFPNLRNLQLFLQTFTAFNKWTESSNFSGVTSLELFLRRDEDNFNLGLSVDTMRSVKGTFPNLRKLELYTSCAIDSSGLQYVFQEMRDLTHLTIHDQFPDRTNLAVSTDMWDSILTGVSPEVVAEAKRNPHFDASQLEQENPASIRNLQEIKNLTLTGYRGCTTFGGRILIGGRRILTSPSISDVTFNCALLKMPNLKHLRLQTRNNVSDEMSDKWRSQGRTLSYFN